MNPVSEDIKDKLVTSGLGTFGAITGWGIFISSEPEKLDTTITLYDTGGPKPQTVQDRSVKPLRTEAIQIRVRGKEYKTAYTKIESIVDAIVGYGKFTAGSTVYKGLFRSSDILFLELDSRGRYIWVVNFQAVRG